MAKLLEMLQREDGALSVGRLCAVLAFVMWVAITAFLVLVDRTWGHYNEFTFACVGFLVAQLFNKAIEWRSMKH